MIFTIFTRDKKIVIHGNSCIILYILCFLAIALSLQESEKSGGKFSGCASSLYPTFSSMPMTTKKELRKVSK